MFPRHTRRKQLHKHVAQNFLVLHEDKPRKYVSPQLIASELFGHVRGAFTGASESRPGAFVAAHGGTLLLDELGDAPLELQLTLLRALESRTVRPVGADREREVDVRVLAATSRDLGALVQGGAFRKDLYYRLAEFVVTLPALRERPEDIPMLARAVLASIDPAARLTDRALHALTAHPLPGNVRELRNVLKRAHALSGGKAITAESLGLDAGAAGAGLAVPEPIARLSRDLWRLGTVVEPPAKSRYEARAQLRAAIIALRSQFPLAMWPSALVGHHRRLFGDRWATTEGGRGLRDVLRVLGYDGRNEEVGGWIVELVG